VFAVDGSADKDSGKNVDEKQNRDADKEDGWSWDNILLSRAPIIANGNMWPPPSNDKSASDFLILVTHHQLMWHCPSGNNPSYEHTTLHRSIEKGK